MVAKKASKKHKEQSSKQKKLSRKAYEALMEKLHGELVKLRYWVKEYGNHG